MKLNNIFAVTAALLAAGGFDQDMDAFSPMGSKFRDRKERDPHFPFSDAELETLSGLEGKAKKKYLKELKQKYSKETL